MQIDFHAAFERVKNQGILYTLCSVGIGGSVLFIFTQFLSNQLQHVMEDDCRSKLVNVVLGCCRPVFRTRCCFFCTLRSLFPLLKISDWLC